jgi:hypothetical protein
MQSDRFSHRRKRISYSLFSHMRSKIGCLFVSLTALCDGILRLVEQFVMLAKRDWHKSYLTPKVTCFRTSSIKSFTTLYNNVVRFGGPEKLVE